MKDYNKYEIEDFLSDPSFQDFALNKDDNAISDWNQWIENHPEKREIVNQAKSLLTSVQFHEQPLSEIQLAKDKERLKTAIDLVESQKTEALHKIKKSKSINWFRFAASISILLVAGIYLISQNTAIFSAEEEQEKPISWISRETKSGEKLTITLQDGTKVKLNSNSQVRFPSILAKDKREIYFKGEGYFDVAKDPKRPFTIHTEGNISTSVLGTSFNMRAYPEENGVEVALVEGKVKVFHDTSEDDFIILNPLERILYNKAKNDFSKDNFNPEKVLAWSQGTLLFENSTFDEVVQKLERWYGVEFIIESKPKFVEGFSGKFDNEVLEDVLIGLSYTSEFKFRIEKNKVYISK